ncbi:hypothetical protein HDU81_008708 [Chytriomyces hyalinus]|nr:hypothetical protein HDU81_008708 [Chytriomyces hyalinus]
MVYVSPPVSMLLVPLLIPLLHFHLLTRTKRPSSWILSALAILANTAASTMLPCEDISIDLMIKGLFCFYFGVRYLELAVLDRRTTSRWSLSEYREFMLTSDNESLRAGSIKKKGKPGKRKIALIPVSARTTSFYVRFAGKFLVMYAGFAFTKAYLVKYGYDYEGIHFVDLTDIMAVVDHLYVALNSYCGIFLVTMGSIFVMLPLYAGPMGRSGSALHIPVPGLFVDTVQAYI